MHTLLSQIEGSLGAGFYYLSLFASLTVPDIAGALDSQNGEATRQKYAEWYETWVRPRSGDAVAAILPPELRQHVGNLKSPLTGEACYRFRCSLLHQGSSQHPKSPFSRIMFVEPGATTNVFHNNIADGAL